MYLFSWRTTLSVLQIPMCFCFSLADFFSLSCGWLLLTLWETTCLFQSPKVASTPTAFRNTAKAVPIYSMSCSQSSRKVNSHGDPNPTLLSVYIVLLGSELINKLCNPEKPVCLVSVITTMFFWENKFLQICIASNFGIISATSSPAKKTYKCSSTTDESLQDFPKTKAQRQTHGTPPEKGKTS